MFRISKKTPDQSRGLVKTSLRAWATSPPPPASPNRAAPRTGKLLFQADVLVSRQIDSLDAAAAGVEHGEIVGAVVRCIGDPARGLTFAFERAAAHGLLPTFSLLCSLELFEQMVELLDVALGDADELSETLPSSQSDIDGVQNRRFLEVHYG